MRPTLPDSTQRRPTRWKEGALSGAVVGLVLDGLLYTVARGLCDSSRCADKPGRYLLVFGVTTGAGAWIGSLSHRRSAGE